MGIKLGTTEINKVYLGGQELSKVYLGNELIYPISQPTEQYVRVIPTTITNDDVAFKNINTFGGWNNRHIFLDGSDTLCQIWSATNVSSSTRFMVLNNNITNITPGHYRATLDSIRREGRCYAISLSAGTTNISNYTYLRKKEFPIDEYPFPETSEEQEHYKYTIEYDVTEENPYCLSFEVNWNRNGELAVMYKMTIEKLVTN